MKEVYGNNTSVKLNRKGLIDVSEIRDNKVALDFNPMVGMSVTNDRSVDELNSTGPFRNKKKNRK